MQSFERKIEKINKFITIECQHFSNDQSIEHHQYYINQLVKSIK